MLFFCIQHEVGGRWGWSKTCSTVFF